MISYNPKEKKLTITLRSEGEGRGTSSDFRNHTEITEFLRYTNKSIRQYVQELECKFYDVRDKLILDIETSNIEETGNTDSKTNDLSWEEAEKKIKALLEDNHLNIEDFSYQELFSSGKEKLCVKASASKEDALALMAVIENLRHSIRAVCQVPDVCIFEMSLAAENEELFCVHDDYLHGHWQSWMSPEMDKEFAKHNGPGE